MSNKDFLYKTGVYFLLRGNKIVYIGQTSRFPNRISCHTDKNFDSYRFIECSWENSLKYESRWIKRFKPEYNKPRIGAVRKYDFKLKKGDFTSLPFSTGARTTALKFAKSNGFKYSTWRDGEILFVLREK